MKNLSILLMLMLLACNSSDDSQPSSSNDQERILLEDYYFRGTIDGQEFEIKTERYNFDSDPYALSIDFGGSSTYEIESEGVGTGDCYGRYACGLLYYESEVNMYQTDEAKMYFTRIPVGECTIENELNAMRSFLNLNNYGYETYPTNEVINAVALDYFFYELEDTLDYYSSRFGDNTDASFEITSADEVEIGTFIVEGNFSCKLYRNSDQLDFKLLENGEFKIKIHSNLEE